jgi:hypothetical protein
MFKLQPNPTFKSEVEIPVAGAEPSSITLVFKHKGKKDLKAFIDSLTGETPKDDIDMLFDIIAGWEGVDAEFNKSNLELLIDNYPQAAINIFMTYQQTLLEGRAKN